MTLLFLVRWRRRYRAPRPARDNDHGKHPAAAEIDQTENAKRCERYESWS